MNQHFKKKARSMKNIFFKFRTCLDNKLRGLLHFGSIVVSLFCTKPVLQSRSNFPVHACALRVFPKDVGRSKLRMVRKFLRNYNRLQFFFLRCIEILSLGKPRRCQIELLYIWFAMLSLRENCEDCNVYLLSIKS